MIPHADLWLILGIIGFYLYDACVLVPPSATVLVRAGSAWTTVTLRSEWLIRGQNVYLPNFFLPGRPFFTVPWSAGNPHDSSDGATDDPDTLARFVQDLRPLQVLVVLQSVLLLLLLPLVIYRFGHGAMMLITIVAIYAVALMAVAYVYYYRELLGVDGKALRSIALDAIACPPFSINLVQKVCKARGVFGDAVALAGLVLDNEEKARFTTEVDAKLNATLAIEDDESKRYQRLLLVQSRLHEEKK